MTTYVERHLKTGTDPRQFADFVALRHELNKLSHPARPDVNWQQAEKLCLTLFEHNGVELQTAAWYTLVRTRLARIRGLNEGLELLEALIRHQWGIMWPQPVHARMEILSILYMRLQQFMRTLVFTSTDLPDLYQAEQHLKKLDELFQHLKLKHQSRIAELRSLLHNAAVHLENNNLHTNSAATGATTASLSTQTLVAATAESQATIRRVYVILPATPGNEKISPRTCALSALAWRAFAAGVLITLLLGGSGLWLWFTWPGNVLKQHLMASVAPLPATLTISEQQAFHPQSPYWLKQAQTAYLQQAQQSVVQLGKLSPDWPLAYGDQLVKQTRMLFPDSTETAEISRQWQEQLQVSAASLTSPDGWHRGMEGLMKLSARLNSLDEKRGKYMTVSELKSVVFTIIQDFNKTIPAEEQLRRLKQIPAGQALPLAQTNEAEGHIKQLITRYFLITHTESEAAKTDN